MDKSILKTCEMCKEKEADEFCKECEQSFCWNCSDYHNNITILKNHRLIRLCNGEPKKESKLNLFCANIDNFLELTMINSNEKNVLKTKEFGIEKRLLKWNEEVKKITDCRAEYKKGVGMDEEKWSVKKKEILEIKTELENNYQEFIEFLQYKQKIECNKIEAVIDKIEEKLINYKKQININKITLKENETAITKKRKLVKIDSEEVTSDTLPPLHLPPPVPMDDLCNLSPPTKPNEMEVIKTTRGRRKLLLNGYAFVVGRQGREDVTHWRCENRSCTGTLATKNGQVIKDKQHTHPPNPVRNICLKAVEKMTLDAQVSSDSTGAIVKKTLSLLPQEAVTSLPSEESLAKTLRFRRNSLYTKT